MKTIATFWQHEIDEIKPGLEFYLVDVCWCNTGEERKDAYKEPGRTNMSGESRIRGWLGTTDNINKEALGKFRLISAKRTKNAPWADSYQIEAEEIEH